MSAINHILKLLDDFSKLPKGWNFGEGVPSSSVALYQSKHILNSARGLGVKEIEAFPGIDGEIQLCFYDSKFTLEIVFEIDGTLTLNLEREDESIFSKKNAVINEAIKILKDFRYKKCHSYESSTSDYITVKGKSGYPVWHSAPHQQITVSPSLIGNVPSRQAKISANISRNSISASQEIRLSFGKSRTKKFLQPVGLSKV